MTTHRLGQGSRWRQYQRATRTAVLCDSLAEAGLWPWRFYDGWRNRLKEVYGDLQWLLPDASIFDGLIRFAPLDGPALLFARDAIYRAENIAPSLRVSAVDLEAGTIDLVPAVESVPAPKQRGRVPSFIPVRRLDGRR